MFKFRVATEVFSNKVSDIDTLEDIALGYLNDEQEARRVSEIAGRMKLHEIYIANNWSLWCKEDE